MRTWRVTDPRNGWSRDIAAINSDRYEVTDEMYDWACVCGFDTDAKWELLETPHPARVGYEVKVRQNGGVRDAVVTEVTRKRVRVEWQKANGKAAGTWFRRLETDTIGEDSIYGAQLIDEA